METLLIVDDAPTVRDKLKSGLSREYNIAEAGDAKEALELFKVHAPKVVVLDLGLPPDPEGTLEGFRCLESMMQCRSGAKIIALTGSDQREKAYRAVACGAYDFYQKPLDLTELNIIIRRAFHLCAIEEQGRRLQEVLERSAEGVERIAGKCAAMQELLAPLQKVPCVQPPEPGTPEPHPVPEDEISITSGHLTLREVRDRVEKSMIHAAVENCGGNMVRASELLGVSRPALYDLMKKHGLFKPASRQ